jgi:16S rRNA (cytosine967-C5)-methyltransferase
LLAAANFTRGVSLAEPGSGHNRPIADDPRSVAWEILQRVEGGGYADALLGHRLNRARLSARDRALTTRLVYGTLAWQGYLDHVIAAFSHRAVAKLDPAIRTLLRLALFQACRLTKIPDFAVVDTAVELAKSVRRGVASGLVNAVLRRAASAWQDVPLPSLDDDPVAALAVRLSHPPWLVQSWLAEYGRERTEALLHADNEPAPTALRVNCCRASPAEVLRRLQAAGCEAAIGRYAPSAIVLETGTGLSALDGQEQGWFALQGEASQLVGFLVAPQPGERVLDTCAAPGGKATHLAELMGDRGEVLAIDISRRGVQRVERLAAQLGLSAVRAVVGDATRLRAAASATQDLGLSLPRGGFDRVLVDAPCSGLGTLRGHPELRWRRNPADVRALARLQSRLLDEAGDQVRPGGILVYATCTLSRAENEDVVGAFLEGHRTFAVDDARHVLPPATHGCIGGDGILRTFPDRHGLDGFFAARLKRHP